MSEQTACGEEITYEYTVEQRLSAVREGGALLMAASYDGDGNRVFQISRSKAVTTVLKSDTSNAEKNPEASNSGIADPETPGSFENNPSGIEDVPSSNQAEVHTYYEKIYVDPADSIFWYGFGQGLMNFFGNINSALSSYLSNWFCTAWDYVTGQYELALHSEEEKESVTYSEADIEAMKKAGLTQEDILAVTCGAEYTESAEICTEGTLTSETVVIPENGDNDTETVNASYELTYYVNNVNTENTQVLMEYGKRDELKSVYTYGLNRISVETIADTYNPAIDEFETDYYLYDGRGSAANVVTDSSEIVASYSYDPFGNITKGAPAFDCFYGYNAEETNPVTGLQYLRARYYDTETGRFGTADTYLGSVTDPLTLNRYAYTVNNPVMQIDPSGHWPKWLDKAADKAKSAVKTVATGVKKAAKATANFVQENAAVIGAAVGIAAAAVVMVVTAPVSVPAMLGTLAVSAGVGLVCAGVGGTVQTNYEAKKQSKKVDAYVEECNDIVKEEEKLIAEIRAVNESNGPVSQAKIDEIHKKAALIEQRKIEAEVKRKHLCEEGERLQKQADLYQNITYAGVGLTAMGFAPLSGPAIATTATGSSVLASMPAIGTASLSQIATGLTYAAGATEVLYAGSNIMELETGNNPIKETFYGGDDEGDAAFEKDLEILNKINIASTLVGAASAVSSGITNYQNAKSQNSGSQNTVPQSTTSSGISGGSAGTSGGTNNINGLPENVGYDSFKQLKNAIGSAGKGKHWHHIVEQSQIEKSGFSAQQIHNTSNIIPVDQATHAKITGYYNTKTFDFTGGLSVRDWLAGQSYEYQYEFGLDVLRQFGVIQ